MLRQERHNRAQGAVLGPGRADRVGPLAADARHPADPPGVGVEHLERALTEGRDDPLGQHRTDLADQARAQIADNAVDVRRPAHLGALRPELGAVARVELPAAGQPERLARLDGRQRADDRDRASAAARLQLDDAEAVLGVVEGDTLDGALERRRLAVHIWWSTGWVGSPPQ